MTANAKEWILRLMKSRSFSNVPYDTLNEIASRMETLAVKAGETIVRGGEAADYYYILQEGHCRIVSRESVMDDTVEVATLGPGESFGEEGLIRGGVRGASVEMMSDGVLARLRKEDFINLIQLPLLKRVDPEEAGEKVPKDAQWIDLRAMTDFAKVSLPGSKNIPSEHLRTMIDTIDPAKPCIFCSKSAPESALAAFILAEKGFDVCYLDGDVLEYIALSGAGDPETLKTLGYMVANDVIDLPEEYAAGTGESVIIMDEGPSDFINLDPSSSSAPSVQSLDELLGRIRDEIQAFMEAEYKNLRQDYEAELHALEEKNAQQLRETKERYRGYFQEREKRLKKKYQSALGKNRSEGSDESES